MSHQRPTCHNPTMRREQDRLDTFHSWTLSIIMPAELAKAGFYYLGQGDRVACFSCGGQVCVLLFVLGLFCLKPFVKTVILQYKNMRQYYKRWATSFRHQTDEVWFCLSSPLQLSNWEPGDRALSEHQRHYPNCRFVRGDRADNVSLAGAAATASLAANSQMSSGATVLTNVSNPAMQQSEERLLTFVNWPSRIPVRPEQLAKAGFYYVGMDAVKEAHLFSDLD